MMYVPKYVDLWIADADGCALAGPILGEMRFRDTPTGVEKGALPVSTVELQLGSYAFPPQLQAYDLDEDATLLWTQTLWLRLNESDTLTLHGWDTDAPKSRLPQCCCRWGAAVRGEWPEFECSYCPKHGESNAIPSCKRHLREYYVQIGAKV